LSFFSFVIPFTASIKAVINFQKIGTH